MRTNSPRADRRPRAKPAPIAAKERGAAPDADRRPRAEPTPPAPKERGAPPGTAWLWGRHAVAAALANPERRVRRIVAARENADDVKALLAAARADVPRGADLVDRKSLAQLLPEDAVHQGIAIAADPLARRELGDILPAAEAAAQGTGAPIVVVLLDQVSDPHNVGAVLRAAAAFGAAALVVPEHGSPTVTGTLAKAASGALETVPLVRAANLARAMEHLKEAGFWCVGLDEEAEQSLDALSLGNRIGLVLGAEGGGLRRLTRERCDYLARLPTRGTPASLNVSTAAAVALYEVTRRKP